MTSELYESLLILAEGSRDDGKLATVLLLLLCLVLGHTTSSFLLRLLKCHHAIADERRLGTSLHWLSLSLPQGTYLVI